MSREYIRESRDVVLRPCPLHCFGVAGKATWWHHALVGRMPQVNYPLSECCLQPSILPSGITILFALDLIPNSFIHFLVHLVPFDSLPDHVHGEGQVCHDEPHDFHVLLSSDIRSSLSCWLRRVMALGCLELSAGMFLPGRYFSVNVI